MCRACASIRDLFEPYNHEKDAWRYEAILAIDALYDQVQAHTNEFVDLESWPSIQVTNIWQVNDDDSPYFRPFPEDRFTELPIDWEFDKRTRVHKSLRDEVPSTTWGPVDKHWGKLEGTMLYDSLARHYAYNAIWEYDVAPRQLTTHEFGGSGEELDSL
ncbi:uncharacterized protein PFLUO_LOCUS5579 [Penicillium psychrofluorescens]|uniref:uncharacterized protein n=1 Tax=Penicillium psychrofluorescens TaxID=3158075 RepID=UPI003CCD8922